MKHRGSRLFSAELIKTFGRSATLKNYVYHNHLSIYGMGLHEVDVSSWHSVEYPLNNISIPGYNRNANASANKWRVF